MLVDALGLAPSVSQVAFALDMEIPETFILLPAIFHRETDEIRDHNKHYYLTMTNGSLSA